MICFQKSRNVYDIMCKRIVKAGEATDDKLAHAYCLLFT
jgi:hypothetical protein